MQRTDEYTLHFDEAAHIYTDNTGFVYAGVTDTVSTYFEKFDADVAIATSRASGTGKYDGMTDDEIKAAWKETAVWGTKMHAGIEYLFKAAIEDSILDKEKLLQLTNQLIQGINHDDVPAEAEHIEQSPLAKWPLTDEDTKFLLPEFEQFLAFAEAQEFDKYCHSEFRVFSPKRGIAGTFDMTTYDDEGNCTIYDWKRTPFISKYGYKKMGFGILSHLDDSKHNHYRVQLNLYRTILEENYLLANGCAPRVKKMKLVSFHKNKMGHEIHDVTPLAETERMFGRKCVLLDLNGVIGVKREKGEGKVSLRFYDFEPRADIEQFIDTLKQKYVVGIYSSCRKENILTCLSSVSADFHEQFAYILDQEYCELCPLEVADESGKKDIFKKNLSKFYAETGRDASSVVLVEHELEKIVKGTTVALVEEWKGGDSPSFASLLDVITSSSVI